MHNLNIPQKNDHITLRVMPIREWQNKISRHWKIEKPSYVSSFNNPFGMIRYFGREIFSKMLFFPVALEVNGQAVAYSSIYNISSTHVRIRGIYVEAPFRGRGYGHVIVDKMLELWPAPWTTVIGYFRPESWETFQRYSRFSECPLIGARISEFSRAPLILGQRHFDVKESLVQGENFIKENLREYGFLGSNNRLTPFREGEGDGLWGYDGVCRELNESRNGRHIFFVDTDKMISARDELKNPLSPIYFKNMSYDRHQRRKIGVDDWVIEFKESRILHHPLRAISLKTLFNEAYRYFDQIEESFTLDEEGHFLSEVCVTDNDIVGANYTHYVPASRFFQSCKIEEAYGSVKF